MHDVTCSLVANLDVLQPKTVDDKVLAASDLKAHCCYNAGLKSINRRMVYDYTKLNSGTNIIVAGSTVV